MAEKDGSRKRKTARNRRVSSPRKDSDANIPTERREGIRRKPKEDTRTDTCDGLERLLISLRYALSAVVICGEALRSRNADLDEEIAQVLRAAGESHIDKALQQAEAMLFELTGVSAGEVTA